MGNEREQKIMRFFGPFLGRSFPTTVRRTVPYEVYYAGTIHCNYILVVQYEKMYLCLYRHVLHRTYLNSQYRYIYGR